MKSSFVEKDGYDNRDPVKEKEISPKLSILLPIESKVAFTFHFNCGIKDERRSLEEAVLVEAQDSRSSSNRLEQKVEGG